MKEWVALCRGWRRSDAGELLVQCLCRGSSTRSCASGAQVLVTTTQARSLATSLARWWPSPEPRLHSLDYIHCFIIIIIIIIIISFIF
ncbi:hypothetical protein CRG98_037865 [Punica granatum]|uniref:Uncharacterized protein n=1 Tax=Punica granatum TaxID=22663 RepID=A0A2I0ID65_PUNGR|nr:hypothetical protein CRG98_037865 [Punica granatum]